MRVMPGGSLSCIWYVVSPCLAADRACVARARSDQARMVKKMEAVAVGLGRVAVPYEAPTGNS
jgi:hypothetical protein